eukprot:2111394-Rhodomonas_salina.3
MECKAWWLRNVRRVVTRWGQNGCPSEPTTMATYRYRPGRGCGALLEAAVHCGMREAFSGPGKDRWGPLFL